MIEDEVDKEEPETKESKEEPILRDEEEGCRT